MIFNDHILALQFIICALLHHINHKQFFIYISIVPYYTPFKLARTNLSKTLTPDVTNLPEMTIWGGIIDWYAGIVLPSTPDHDTTWWESVSRNWPLVSRDYCTDSAVAWSTRAKAMPSLLRRRCADFCRVWLYCAVRRSGERRPDVVSKKRW